jgi:hypothetical protein
VKARDVLEWLAGWVVFALFVGAVFCCAWLSLALD